MSATQRRRFGPTGQYKEPADDADGTLRTARLVYPPAVAGLAVSILLNAISWFPVDVSGLTTIWWVTFLGLFAVGFPVGHIFRRRLQALRGSQQSVGRSDIKINGVPWSQMFPGIPAWTKIAAVVVLAYAVVNAVAIAVFHLPWGPSLNDGRYYLGSFPTDRRHYLAALLNQQRVFSGFQIFWYGVAALTTFEIRGRGGPPQDAGLDGA